MGCWHVVGTTYPGGAERDEPVTLHDLEVAVRAHHQADVGVHSWCAAGIPPPGTLSPDPGLSLSTVSRARRAELEVNTVNGTTSLAIEAIGAVQEATQAWLLCPWWGSLPKLPLL